VTKKKVTRTRRREKKNVTVGQAHIPVSYTHLTLPTKA